MHPSYKHTHTRTHTHAHAHTFLHSAISPAQWHIHITSRWLSQVPWVVVHGHRSIYCSCDGDCDGAATLVRSGPCVSLGGLAWLLYTWSRYLIVVASSGSLLCMLQCICCIVRRDAHASFVLFGIVRYGLEEIFMDYGVDFFLNGHEHNYVCNRVCHTTDITCRSRNHTNSSHTITCSELSSSYIS